MTVFLAPDEIGTFFSHPAIIAVLSAILGGVGIRVLDYIIEKQPREKEYLTDELKELRTRLDEVEKEVTEWRDRFYVEQERNAVLRIQLIQAGIQPADNIGLVLEIKPHSKPEADSTEG